MAAATTMVVQPNAALGNAPKNPRYILYPNKEEILHHLGQIPLK